MTSAFDITEFGPDESEPRVVCDRGISALTGAERRQGADRHLFLVREGSLLAHCSCWWRDTASLDGEPIGAIGHYAAADDASAHALLSRACAVLAQAGCRRAVGPMDGNTWRRYRFVVERGPTPPFFLEPDNPDNYPRQWETSGFSRLAHYTSAVNAAIEHEDARTAAALSRLSAEGISIRPFDPVRAEDDLHRMFELSLTAFARNFLYTPLAESDFMAQNRALLPLVNPEFVLLAEGKNDLVGLMFAVPDALQAKRGEAIDTIVVKTLAVHPRVGGMGLGGALTDLVQRRARQLGFRRAIHALMHEDNISQRVSHRYAATIRRYALFARRLATR